MARNRTVSGHTDRVAELLVTIGMLRRDVERLRTIVLRDALLAPGYVLEHRPEGDPPGLYIVKKGENPDDGRYICP